MAVDRRGFLRALLGGAVGLALAPTLDLERLLWVPGAKSIFLPAARGITLAEVDALAKRIILPGIVDNFFTSGPLLAYLKDRGPLTFHGAPILENQYAPTLPRIYRDAHDGPDPMAAYMRDR